MSNPSKPERLFSGDQYPPEDTLNKLRRIQQQAAPLNVPMQALLHRVAAIGADVLLAHPEYLIKPVPVKKLSPK